MAAKELTFTMAESERAGPDSLAAFDDLMVSHQRQVLGVALRMLGNLEDAKDAAQEVFYRMYKQRGRLERGRDLSPWLYRVTVNVCHDVRRKRTELPLEAAPEPATDEAPVEFGMDLAARRELVRRALRHLPEKERAALVLREIEGLSTREVAEALGSSEATVRSQVSTARVKLRDFCAALLRKRR